MSLAVPAGTVQALVGANGAGKSTLVRILAGVERADSGTISIDGVPEVIATPQAATKLGLSFIHQELNLVPKFTVLQNLALNFGEHRRLGVVNWRRVEARADAVMKQLGADFPLDRVVDRLTVSERWMVSLGRSLMRRARLIAMDEPTASFAVEEAERLFAIVRQLTAGGVAVLYISHRLDEVLDLSNHITVLRNGRVIDTYQASTTSRRALTEAIVGRDVPETVRHEVDAESTETMLRPRDIVRAPRVNGVSLDIRAGEILGPAGLVGAGRTELAHLIFGAETPTSGTMTLAGAPVRAQGPVRGDRPRRRPRAGGAPLAGPAAEGVAVVQHQPGHRPAQPLARQPPLAQHGEGAPGRNRDGEAVRHQGAFRERERLFVERWQPAEGRGEQVRAGGAAPAHPRRADRRRRRRRSGRAVRAHRRRADDGTRC